MMSNGYGYGGMGFAGIGMLLFWVLLIAGVVALVRWSAGPPTQNPPPPEDPDPLEILALRYARGEIDKEEFEQKRRDLSQT